MTTAPDLDTTIDRSADAAWLLAAVTRRMLSQGDVPDSPLERAVTDVLARAGIEVEAGGMALGRGLSLRSQLAQVLSLADASQVPQWGDLDDDTLLAQGRASGITGRFLADPAGPAPAELVARVRTPGAVVLDVGVGVGAACAAMCRELPELRCVGIDVLPRALALAERELAAAGVSDRVELRLQDVQDLTDHDAFDLAWVPLPLLPEDVARTAVGVVARSLKPGGWLVVAAGRPHPDPLVNAVSRLRAVTVGGNPAPRDEVEQWIAAAGLVDLQEVPLPPGAPLLLTARAPQS